jgi:hypothetical protein
VCVSESVRARGSERAESVSDWPGASARVFLCALATARLIAFRFRGQTNDKRFGVRQRDAVIALHPENGLKAAKGRAKKEPPGRIGIKGGQSAKEEERKESRKSYGATAVSFSRKSRVVGGRLRGGAAAGAGGRQFNGKQPQKDDCSSVLLSDLHGRSRGCSRKKSALK